MKSIYHTWWQNGSKYFTILKKIPPEGTDDSIHKHIVVKLPWFLIATNGASRKNGDRCFDIHVYIGPVCFNYTNFELQKGWSCNVKQP